jgi:hypothetical protein
MNYYSYFFTRQDISPEQQLVQTAHVALKLGVNSTKPLDKGVEFTVPYENDINPDETYFTCIGVRNAAGLYAVMQILEKFGFRYEVFYEPDIGNEPTAIAVYPISELMKGPLEAFNLLKMK